MFHVASTDAVKTWQERGPLLALVLGVMNLLALDFLFAPAAFAPHADAPPAASASAHPAIATAETSASAPPRIVLPAAARVPTIVARFERASTEADDESGVRALATAMIEDHDVAVVLEGHSDLRGGDDANHAVSLERANWVKARLVALGVSPDRIEAVGLSATRPLRSDEGDGRSVNRRVEVRWVDKAALAAVAKAAEPRMAPSAVMPAAAAPVRPADAGATPAALARPSDAGAKPAPVSAPAVPSTEPSPTAADGE
jgi:outer membrane protein OmpA-like peptidoglycan-associated protein